MSQPRRPKYTTLWRSKAGIVTINIVAFKSGINEVFGVTQVRKMVKDPFSQILISLLLHKALRVFRDQLQNLAGYKLAPNNYDCILSP